MGYLIREFIRSEPANELPYEPESEVDEDEFFLYREDSSDDEDAYEQYDLMVD
jgi:hypothetical protein